MIAQVFRMDLHEYTRCVNVEKKKQIYYIIYILYIWKYILYYVILYWASGKHPPWRICTFICIYKYLYICICPLCAYTYIYICIGEQ